MATTKIFATQILAIPPGSAQTVLNQGPEQSKPGPARAEQGHWSSSEYLLDMALREVEDKVTGARDGDERAGTGMPELQVEWIHTTKKT